MNLEGLDMSILAPAFVAGMVVLMTHIPLGYEVLRRGIIFIDIAIAQIAGLGVLIAYTLGWDEHGFGAHDHRPVDLGQTVFAGMGIQHELRQRPVNARNSTGKHDST